VTRAHGFSLIELLMALTICALISAGVAAVVPPARTAFEVAPAEIELQQRSRTAIDVIAHAIRSAGADAVAPALIPSVPDASGRFTRLQIIAASPNAAEGILAYQQPGPNGALTLALERCPAGSGVCGFVRDTTALIADGSGRFDVFTVLAADAATNRIVPGRSLTPPYPAGSVLIGVEVSTFRLATQPDGSHALVRVSAAGAVQPVVDRVSALWFEPHARRVDVALTLQAAPPLRVERAIRFAVFLRNVP
jgi:prepilin-type N-terminal cleavage/methylation domain-containing protein